MPRAYTHDFFPDHLHYPGGYSGELEGVGQENVEIDRVGQHKVDI